MTKYLILITLCAFTLAACGSKEEANPQQAAYKSFKAFADSTYPATSYKMSDKIEKNCNLSKVDVVKTDSAANPFVGVIEGAGGYTMEGLGAASATAFKLVFHQENGTWTCKNTESSGVTDADSLKRDSDPCGSLNIYCTGKDN